MSILLAMGMAAAAFAWGVAVVSAFRAYRAARRSGQPGAGRAFTAWFSFARSATGDAAVEVRRTHRAMLAFAAAWVVVAVCGIILAISAPGATVALPAA